MQPATVTQQTLKAPNNGAPKESLRETRSDPDSRARRARWIRDKILFSTSNTGNKSDSGFQDIEKFQTPPPDTNNSRLVYPHARSWDTIQQREAWSPVHLKKDLSLPISNQSTLSESNKQSILKENPLTRRNGVRYSIKVTRSRSQSPCSISSEESSRQGDCENSLDPNLLLPDSQPGRKTSVFSASYDSWNESKILSGFKDLSPLCSSILEAAWKGEIAVLEELLTVEANVQQIRNHEIRDKNDRTPLHMASACGHIHIVRLLLNYGVDTNLFDNQKATPLCCAASCGSVNVLQLLIDHGADVNAGFDYGKTALHWACTAQSVECAKIILENGGRQNPPLIYTETPLHIAAALGDADTLKLLLEYGADVGLCKGTYKTTALHLAAEEGSAACIRLLMEYGAGHNSKDGRGHTALHIAATSDVDAVAALLSAGADANIADSNGRTPIHAAIGKGSRAAEVVRLLMDNGADIDAQDDFGYTPLHLAAVQDSSQCASILLKHGADVTIKTKAGTSALSLLVRRIPDVMRYLVERLDSAVTIHEFDPADPDCEIRLDFRAIVPNSENKQLKGSKKIPTHIYSQSQKRRKETEFLTCVLAAGNKKILSHPLSEAFLTLKWLRVRKFFWASLLFQIALVLLFTVFVVEVYIRQCPMSHMNETGCSNETIFRKSEYTPPTNIFARASLRFSNTTTVYKDSKDMGMVLNATIITDDDSTTASESENKQSNFEWFRISQTTSEGTVPNSGKIRGNVTKFRNRKGKQLNQKDNPVNGIGCCTLDGPLTVVWGLLIAFACMMGIKEVFQIVQAPVSYIVSSENWGQWALILSVGLAAFRTPRFDNYWWQYPAAACGIFLAWGLMLLQVGRFPALGLYVQMLAKVAANFGVFISAYACLLMAFALGFCVLFPGHPTFSSVPLALLKVLTMMVGEVDYEDLFYPDDPKKELLHPITSHIFLGAFVVLCTVVLMNLLVGLAVHDIQGLQKGAKLNRLSRQTALISRLESFIFSKRLQSCLPRRIGYILQESALLVPSSYKWSYYIRPNDIRDKRLPKDLKMAALKLAAARHSAKRATKHRQELTDNKSQINTNNELAFKRLEVKLSNLQDQIEQLMKSLVEKNETMTVLNENV